MSSFAQEAGHRHLLRNKTKKVAFEEEDLQKEARRVNSDCRSKTVPFSSFPFGEWPVEQVRSCSRERGPVGKEALRSR